MRVLLQRVKEASVTISGRQISNIGKGMLVLLGIENADSTEDIEWLCRKISNLRIFPDEQQVMNRSIVEVEGAFLVVSQFTLQASTKKGNRPSYIKAAKPDIAIPLYKQFLQALQQYSGLKVAAGKFGADMQVALINDGPVTIFIDSKNKE